MKFSQVAVLAYGVLYFILASAMEVENLNQGYPIAFVVCSMLAETLIVCGIFLFGLEASPDYARIWRWLFPILVLEQAANIAVDAAILPDAFGAYWMANEFFGLWVAAPAYYFNFQVARYGR
jgi:hypothetical protein